MQKIVIAALCFSFSVVSAMHKDGFKGDKRPKKRRKIMESKKNLLTGTVELLPYTQLGSPEGFAFNPEGNTIKKVKEKEQKGNSLWVLMQVESKDSPNWHNMGVKNVKPHQFPEYIPFALVKQKEEGDTISFLLHSKQEKKDVSLELKYEPLQDDPPSFGMFYRLLQQKEKELRALVKDLQKSEKKKKKLQRKRTGGRSDETDWDKVLSLFNQGFSLREIGIYEYDIPESRRVDFRLPTNVKDIAQTKEKEVKKDSVQDFAEGIPMEISSEDEDEDSNDLDLHRDYSADTQEYDDYQPRLQEEFSDEDLFGSEESD